MSFKMEGFDDLQRKLQRLAEGAKELEGTKQVPLTELLSPDFLSGCSSFASLEEMFTASGFKIESQEDFKAIPDEDWDVFIRTHTSFDTWKALLGDAGASWAKRKIGL